MLADKSTPFDLPGSRADEPRRKATVKRCLLLLFGLLGFAWLYQPATTCLRSIPEAIQNRISSGTSTSAQCSQAGHLNPSEQVDLWTDLRNLITGDAVFKKRAIEWISGAVRVPTPSFDALPPVSEDPAAWEHFGPFHDYLLGAFPLVHTTLKLQKVNTYGLLYTWEGSDSSLKPILLLAHQDVVPVEQTTIDKWTHAPYSGYYDGESVWGRGSSDDKSGLIGILTAVETLISKDFKPTRTVVLSFGFDEESRGIEGAGALAEEVLNIYGPDGVAFLVDEGGGFQEAFGTTFATPGVAEKGYLDVRIELSTSGGHSSIPPSHTSIGILSHLIHEIERTPFKAVLARESILYSGLLCQAAYSKEIPHPLKKLIGASQHSKVALLALEEIVLQDPANAALVGTTQAVDLIGGGAKVNALPEQAWAVVNHRISTESTIQEVQDKDAKRLKLLAHRYNLTYTAFGSSIIPETPFPDSGSLTLSDAFYNGLEPAPRTPITTEDAAWQLLSGTIKAVYDGVRGLEQDSDEGIVVSPGQNTGNTDTRYYWDVTRHIFRYNHSNGKREKGLGNIHTVNEHLNVESFLEEIYFFTTLILNADQARNL